jgi:hypothetical protein
LVPVLALDAATDLVLDLQMVTENNKKIIKAQRKLWNLNIF